MKGGKHQGWPLWPGGEGPTGLTMLATSSSPGPAQGVTLRRASWGLGGGKRACPRPGTHPVGPPGISQKLQQASTSAAERGSSTFRRVHGAKVP